MSVVIARAITRPLVSLREAAEQIGEGNLKTKLPAETSDDVGRLTQAFDTMSERLRESFLSLKQRTEQLGAANEEMEREVQERRRAEETVRHQAYHDALTGLPNRDLFSDRLTVEIAQARRHGYSVAVLFLDVDRFKLINDTLGHSSGDEVLKAVAKRLEELIREGDTAARIGGDEFSVILTHVANDEEVIKTTERILDGIRELTVIEDSPGLQISASVGVALFPEDGGDVETLVSNADAAMYRAKDNGRDRLQRFVPEINATATNRITIDSELRLALERGEFVLYYQPQVSLVSSEIVGMEALIRWEHPQRGLMYPDDFIPIAEESDLIIAIGEWVLNEACAQARIWNDGRATPLRMAVNVSARELRSPDLILAVAGKLIEHGVPPNVLDLEVTKGAAMDDVEHTRDTLQELRKLGVHVSIDDLGTGYSSLAYLRRLPIDAIKIDRSFMERLTEDKDDEAIVAAIVGLGKTLDLRVLAEGVETESQLDLIRKMDCDSYQGFLFSQPVSAAEFEKRFLKKKTAVTSPA